MLPRHAAVLLEVSIIRLKPEGPRLAAHGDGRAFSRTGLVHQVVGLYFEGHGCFVVLCASSGRCDGLWFVRQPFGGRSAGGAAFLARQRSWRFDSDRVAALRGETTPRQRLVGTLWLPQGT